MIEKEIKKERRTFTGRIKLELTDKDGNIKTTRICNTFTDVGNAHVADQLDATPGEAAMGFMAVGTSAVAFAVGSTTLGSELDRNALSGSYPEQGTAADDNDVVYKSTWAAGDGTGAITEAGIFNSSVADAGTMLAASTFSVMNKGSSDTLTIVWTVSCG